MKKRRKNNNENTPPTTCMKDKVTGYIKDIKEK